MNIELLILWLNFLAAIFMGVEYLCNAPLHKKIDNWLADKLILRENFTNNALKEEMPILRESNAYYMFFLIFLTMIVTAGLILTGGFNVWPFSLLIGGWSGLFLAIAFAITFLIFMSLAVNLIPALPFLAFSFLSMTVRKCPKGVMAGFGFALLLTSFSFQFYKAYGW